MSLRIQGLGWATPLGRELEAVWQSIKAGGAAPETTLANPFNTRTFPVRRIDPSAVADVSRHPRLRRSSAISLFAAAAAQDAMKACDPSAERLALVFVSTNGGVVYTRRFFEDVSKSGTHAGSPLLFPETVYNAPASHIAALLGIEGIATTLVNDATAIADAIATAEELLDTEACDRCLVVAAEEADWVLCEACAAWKLAPVFGEGAAAILLGRDGDGPAIQTLAPTASFRSRKEARALLAGAAGGSFDILVSSAAGTPFDEIESDLPPPRLRCAPKAALGEAFAASALMQVVAAALAIREAASPARALIPLVGFQGQVAAVELRSERYFESLKGFPRSS